MHRSSERIGSLAGALAQAQSELANPEKSLTALIPAAFPREETQSFRYASLASGLDLVRKCLGRHEIATFQTTAIDPEAGLIRLTTVLAHSSGEWMSSDWPVCPVTETNSPHRMGAALTYARRYALFTLVGIAGEDDLDAPDLLPQNQRDGLASHGSPAVRTGNGTAARSANGVSRGKATPSPLRLPLDAEASARTREQLLAGMAEQSSITDLNRWAYRGLPIKNTLTASDARAIEAAFEVKLAALESDASADLPVPASPSANSDGTDRPTDTANQIREDDGSGCAAAIRVRLQRQSR